MMLPAPKEVTPAPRNSCSPVIREILVRMLPWIPWVAMAAASASSPRSMSLNLEPDMPSVDSKRDSREAEEGAIGASLKARRRMSMLTPAGSSRNTAQSKPDIPM
ncbi:hypothetical protein D3C84_544470 [compost metagenome]